MQNAVLFRKKIGFLLKYFPGIEFEFVDAPFQVTSIPPHMQDYMEKQRKEKEKQNESAKKAENIQSSSSEPVEAENEKHSQGISLDVRNEKLIAANPERVIENMRTWFEFLPNSDPAIPPQYPSWKETIAFVNSVFKAKGPFDGIMGFSQGAQLLTLLIAILAFHANNKNKQDLLHPFASIPLDSFDCIMFNYGFFCGGALIRDEKLKETVVACGPFELPTIHVCGESDPLALIDRALLLTDQFKDPQVVVHPGGHYLPSGAEMRAAYECFFVKVGALIK